MDEKDPQLSHEEEKIPLDRQIRDLATQLGIEETPEITELFKPVDERADVPETMEYFEAQLDIVREKYPKPIFDAWAECMRAARDIQKAYNELWGANVVLSNLETHPEVLVQIEALMAEL